MTTALATETRGTSPHVWRVVRLNFVNKWTTLGVPWLALGAILLANIVIWWAILSSLSGKDRVNAEEGFQYSGSTAYVFIYMLIVAIQVINATFPFALGFGVTRREFSLGTALSFAILSVGYGLAMTLLSYIEEWTHGWWLGGHMFTAVYYGEGPWFERLFVFTGALLFFFFVGAAAATVFVRWRTNGLLFLGGGILLVVAAAVAIITMTQSWGAFGSTFLAGGSVGVIAWLLVPTVISAVAGFFVLRRATPRG